MKKVFALLLTGLLAMGMVGCGGSSTVDENTLVMATNAEFPPYEYYEADEIVGIDVEIGEAIAEKLGMELQIEDMGYDAIITAVSSGKADFGIAGMTVTTDRLRAVDFSIPYTTAIQMVIVKEGSDIKEAKDLLKEGANNLVGVQIGTTGDLYTSRDIEQAGLGTVERYSKGSDAVWALMDGKIDCVVIDKEPAREFVEMNEGLTMLPTEYAIEEYAICFAKDSELTEKVNTALEELIADGTVDGIIHKYLTTE